LSWRRWLVGGGIAVTVAAGIGLVAWAGGPGVLAKRGVAACDRLLIAHGFAVRRVTFTGAQRTPAKAIARAAAIDGTRSILALDLDAIRARVEALPWVRRAAVTRLLPGTVRIDVEERHAIAVWQHKGRLWLIDEDGSPIMAARADAHPDLGLVVGAGANVAAAELRRMLGREQALAARVKAAVRVGERRWDLAFDSGTVVALPETAPDAAWRKLAAMQARHGLLDQGYGRLDLRQPGLLVARPAKAGPVRRQAAGNERAT